MEKANKAIHGFASAIAETKLSCEQQILTEVTQKAAGV
jgi:hypothetical protein